MRMNQRLAIVTGTSSGIGAALAEALLRGGWTVVGLARREADIADPNYRHFQIDLSDLEALEELARAELRPLLADPSWQRAGLVNNAATVGSLRGLEFTDPHAYAQLLAVNTAAPVFLMGLAVNSVAAQLPLRIVNISTGAAGHALCGLGEYGSSKAALRMAGMVLAEELASLERPGGPRPDVAILSYEPGLVETRMQVQARSASATEFPWSQLFKDFDTQGLLVPPEAVVGEIVSFLDGDPEEPFVEKRYAGVGS
jgi:benzil reductase ((S)-benzoin forming)